MLNTLIDKRNWISQWTRLKKAITGDLKNQNLKSFELQETFYNHLLLIRN
jgi:hypothetical protein